MRSASISTTLTVPNPRTLAITPPVNTSACWPLGRFTAFSWNVPCVRGRIVNCRRLAGGRGGEAALGGETGDAAGLEFLGVGTSAPGGGKSGGNSTSDAAGETGGAGPGCEKSGGGKSGGK